jgi:hypothetical protein
VLRPGKPVERRPLLGRAQQPVVVGLAVQGVHVLAVVAEHGRRGAPAADMRPRPALGGHGPAQQQGAVLVRLGAEVGDPALHGGARPTGQPESALDDGPPGVGPDPPRVGPATEEQPEPGDDHGLAGTGLACDHCQSWAERKRRVLDDAKPGDAEFLQHNIRP